ncbi:hypothetical protein EV359DRAFT_82827 [Lentinula novae-zelandiae]|nr:hypothetical protein EV359DRAFT_82827 [Lentinula novae-zelandiae]
MSEQPTGRYYASKQYLLPADNVETQRLNTHHNVIVNAFGSKLSVAPTNLTTGDRVLESAAGSGIWALEFFEKNRAEGRSSLPPIHPKSTSLSTSLSISLILTGLTRFPSDTFSFAHQRLLVAAMNDTLWHAAVAELFRVVKPGGWVELVEIEAQDFSSWSVGPNSTKLASLINALYGGKGVSGDLSVYLPVILKEAGLLRVKGYGSDMWRDLWMGMMGPVIEAGGYGVVDTVEEYEALVRGTEVELKNSQKGCTTFFAILARKPENT